MTEDAPKLNQINLVVADMPRTVEFYRKLGLDIADTSSEWQPHHRNARASEGLDLDFDSIKFAQEWERGWRGSAPGVVLGFGVPSREAVDDLYARMTGAGSSGQQEPHDACWGARYAIVEDPDGNPVGIMSPIDPSLRRNVTPP